jgi:hypothetical protein
MCLPVFAVILHAMAEEPVAAPALYKDDDLVYVDPDKRVVVGLVEWLPSGKPKALARPSFVNEKDDDEEDTTEKKGVVKRPVRRAPRIRYYPWGTYRSMKRVYKLEGKMPREESPYTLDDVIEKALSQPFWD